MVTERIPLRNTAGPAGKALMVCGPRIRWERIITTSKGIVFAAMKIGVNLPSRFKLTPENFATFMREVGRLEDESIKIPLIIAAAASISGMASGKAVYEFPDHLDAVKALQESLAILTWRLEDRSSEKPYDPAVASARFAEKAWKDNWARARDAAARVEEGMRVQIVAGGESVAKIGEVGPALVQIVGIDGKLDPLAWNTFCLRSGTLGEDPALAASLVPVIDFLAGIRIEYGGKSITAPSKGSVSFLETVFPPGQYPKREIVMEAKAHHLLAVLPYPEGMRQLEFTAAVPLMDCRTRLDVITGEGWHTRDGQYSFPGVKGEMGNVTVPSKFGKTAYFKGQGDADISARRREQAQKTGDLISKRIVIVLKPAILADQAVFRRNILSITESNYLSMFGLGDRLLTTTNFEPLYLQRLLDRGLIDQPKLSLLQQLIETARTMKRLQDYQSRSPWDGEAMRGGDGGFKYGGLHTGVGGYAGNMGSIQESYEPDPFASPVVYVIYPFGVAHSEDLQPDINAGVALASNVVQLRRS